VPGGEDQSRFNPGRASAGMVGILLSPADLERSDAQTGQGQVQAGPCPPGLESPTR